VVIGFGEETEGSLRWIKDSIIVLALHTEYPSIHTTGSTCDLISGGQKYSARGKRS
jgi:hypothetical protein